MHVVDSPVKRTRQGDLLVSTAVTCRFCEGKEPSLSFDTLAWRGPIDSTEPCYENRAFTIEEALVHHADALRCG